MEDTLWFDQFTLLVFVAPFLGLLAAGLTRRRDPVIKGKRVLRHDGAARTSHWAHAIGTMFLLISGIVLGTRFTPSFVGNAEGAATWFNVHFVFALLFLFGTFFWLGNTIVSRYRFREHLPTKNVVSYTLQHYGALLGIKSCKVPPESKYFESERAAFILALAASSVVVVSGISKVLAHAVDLPGAFVNVMTWAHDIGAVLMLLFFVAHVFFAAIAPFSWKTFPSMITGYLSLDHAREEHAGWIEELESAGSIEAEEDEDAETSGVWKEKEGVRHV